MDPIEDIQNYKFGIFYCNTQDVRTIITKRTRLGWTINFGSSEFYLFLVVTLGIIYVIYMDR
ncbi:hypothetical protein ACSBL2_22565 [Pedobacter sp. AW31-3R]|uniref:hypothetical protein n=1 Tax=Pedobacter sp. AW31-3R TaxID=3445781 RepID=UPI003F9EF5E0